MQEVYGCEELSWMMGEEVYDASLWKKTPTDPLNNLIASQVCEFRAIDGLRRFHSVNEKHIL